MVQRGPGLGPSVCSVHGLIQYSASGGLLVLIVPNGGEAIETAAKLATDADADNRVVRVKTHNVWSHYEDTSKIANTLDSRGGGRSLPWRRARELRANAEDLLASKLGLGQPIGQGVLPQSQQSQRVSAAFYSALERGIGSIDSDALTAAGWMERVKGLVNKGTVKAEEVEWSGLPEWLEMKARRISPGLEGPCARPRAEEPAALPPNVPHLTLQARMTWRRKSRID